MARAQRATTTISGRSPRRSANRPVRSDAELGLNWYAHSHSSFPFNNIISLFYKALQFGNWASRPSQTQSNPSCRKDSHSLDGQTFRLRNFHRLHGSQSIYGGSRPSSDDQGWLYPVAFCLRSSAADWTVFCLCLSECFPPAHREGETRSRSREFPVFSMSVSPLTLRRGRCQ